MRDRVDRVRRLLALAARAGTDHESETAGDRAREVMSRYGVTARDVVRAEADLASAALDVASPDESWRRQIAFLAARRRGCRVYVVPGGYRIVGVSRDARLAASDFRRVAVEIDLGAARAATKHVWKIEKARVVWFDAFRDRAVHLLTEVEMVGPEKENAKKSSDNPWTGIADEEPVAAKVQDPAPKIKGGDVFGKHVKEFTSGWKKFGTPKISAEEAAEQVIEAARERADAHSVSFDVSRVRLLAARSHLGWADRAEVAEVFLKPLARWRMLAARSHLGWADRAEVAEVFLKPLARWRMLAARSCDGWADEAHLRAVAEEHAARTTRRALVAADDAEVD